MKSILFSAVITLGLFLASCNSNGSSTDDANKNEMDSVGKPSSHPSSTAVLVDDSTRMAKDSSEKDSH